LKNIINLWRQLTRKTVLALASGIGGLRFIAGFSLLSAASMVQAFTISVDDNIIVNEDAAPFLICQLDNDNANGAPVPIATPTNYFANSPAVTAPVLNITTVNDASCSNPIVPGAFFNAFLVTLVPDASGSYNGLYYSTTDAVNGNFVGTNCGNPESTGTETDSCGNIFITVTSVNDEPRVDSPFADFTAVEDDPDDATDIEFVFEDVDIATNADVLVYTVSGNTNSALVSASIVGSTLTLDYQSDASGSVDITLRATDLALAFVEDTFTVTVESVNDQPININGSYPDLTVLEDSADILIQLASAFTDADIDSDSDSSDDSLSYTITMDDVPNLFVTTAVIDISGLNVISQDFNVPSPGARRVVVETTSPTISLPLHDDAHGEVTVTVTATDLGRPPADPAAAAPLSDSETFTLTVQSVGDDTPVASDDHYSDRPDLIIDEDSDPIAFIVTDNDYAGDAPIIVLVAGQEITDSFGGDHSWRSGFRLADPDNIGSFQIEINGEVSCANDGCQLAQSPDTIVDGSQITTNQVIYRPRTNFNGEDSFIYCIQDSAPGSEAPFVKDVSDPRCATITVMVNAVNDLPEPQEPITFTMDQASDLIVTVEEGLRTKVLDIDNTHMDGLGCDPLSAGCNPGAGDPQPDTLYFFISSSLTEFGNITEPLPTDGSFEYRPLATFFGEDEFLFDVCETHVPTPATCVQGIRAHIVVASISGAPEGSSDDIVEFDFNLSQIPLELPVGPEANVLIVNDDSGSMGWDILTDQNNGYYYFSSGDYLRYALKATAGGSTYVAPSEQTVPGQGLWRIRNSTFNTVYYNPEVLYEPWEGLNSDDVDFPESTPTAARHNPLTTKPITNLRLLHDYQARALVVSGEETCEIVCVFFWFGSCLLEQEVCTGGGGFKLVPEKDFYIPRYYSWDDKNGNGILDATPSPASQSLTSEGTLVEIRPASEGGSDTYPKSEFRTDCVTNDTTCSYEEELQNFSNWFTYARNREYAVKSALGKVIAAVENIRVGYAKLNGSNNIERIKSMNTSSRTGAKADLLDAIYVTNSSGGTPLRRALRDAGRHFECTSGDLFNSKNTAGPGDPDCPILAAPEGNCQHNYALLISDGAWNGSFPNIGDADDDNNSNFDGGVYASSSDETLADVAMHFYERDLHSTLSNEVPAGARDIAGAAEDAFENNSNVRMHQHMKTYTVGFGVNGEVSESDVPTDYTQSFNWGSPTTTARKIDDLRHAAINGRGLYLDANNPTELTAALIKAFEEFAQGSGAASAVSFNSQEIREDTLIFRSFYNTRTNTGDLVAHPIDEDGNVGEVVWSSAVQLDLVTFDEREIMTWDPDLATGIPFRAASLTDPQRAVFINSSTTDPIEQNLEVLQRVNYLRGDNSNERPAGNFRERPVIEGRMGDVVHSAPTFIDGPSRLGRDAVPYPQNANVYSIFRNAHVHRQSIVYSAANDGMLHGFSAVNGDEEFAYLPNNLMLGAYSRRITELLDFSYEHKYFIDLTPAANDVFINVDGDGSGDEEWASILVGGHGAGGKAYFALNITDPTKFAEGTADEVVLWEFTDDDDSYPTESSGPSIGQPLEDADGNTRLDQLSPKKPVKDLGYTFSVPTLTMSNLTGAGPLGTDHKWISIFGNGYNSTSGIAKLFVLFIDAGIDGTWCHPDMIYNEGITSPLSLPSECVGTQDFVKIDTTFGVQSGVPNGLGEPRAIDVDGNGTADFVYAGDFFGNFFRFDIREDDHTKWTTTKIFEATYDDGTSLIPQPITTQPIAIVHPSQDTGFIIIFGTGSYIREGDSTDASIQSIYGIWDELGPRLIDKSELVEQEYTTIIDELGRVRLLTDNEVDYGSGGKKGWYIDLDIPAAGQSPGSTPEFAGEKAIRNIQLRGGLGFVNSVFPRSEFSCVGLAGGATLSFCPDTGGSKCLYDRTVFDLNNDGFYNELDDVGPDDNLTALGRILEDSAPPTDATFIGDKRVTQFGKELDIVGTNTSFGDNTGRLSWKRLESVN
jgi:type IV pilus assembly protein PilY1